MGGLEFVGRVVSNRMQKTVVVAVNYAVWVPKYKVYEKRVSRHMAHDAQQQCNVGDVVRIRVGRKYSKHKSFRVMQLLKRANVFSPEAVQAAEAARNARPEVTPLAAAEARLSEVQARLAKLRQLWADTYGPDTPLPGSLLLKGQPAAGQRTVKPTASVSA